jgi:hypothetical protein
MSLGPGPTLQFSSRRLLSSCRCLNDWIVPAVSYYPFLFYYYYLFLLLLITSLYSHFQRAMMSLQKINGPETSRPEVQDWEDIIIVLMGWEDEVLHFRSHIERRHLNLLHLEG